MCAGVVVLVALAALGIIAFLFHHRSMNIDDPVVDKRGAGLFLVCVFGLLCCSSSLANMRFSRPGRSACNRDCQFPCQVVIVHAWGYISILSSRQHPVTPNQLSKPQKHHQDGPAALHAV